jgi:transcriptional regulator of acetoin/glycerol metabolism
MTLPARKTLYDHEHDQARRVLVEAVKKLGVVGAARSLGIRRETVWRRLRRYGIVVSREPATRGAR